MVDMVLVDVVSTHQALRKSKRKINEQNQITSPHFTKITKKKQDQRTAKIPRHHAYRSKYGQKSVTP